MTGRRSARSRVLAALALTAAVAGCRPDRTPRRVPDDGAPCSVMMPGPADSREAAIRLGAVAVTERSWELRPSDRGVEPATAATMYALRRGSVPAGAALRDAALLDAAAARVARGVALQAGTNPTIAAGTTPAGPTVELRWSVGPLRSATRLHLIPGGYCEVSILGAHAEPEIASFFATTHLGPQRRY